MEDRDLVSAARHALAHLGDEAELPRNPLLRAAGPPLPYEALRAATLRALESLAPGVPDAKRRRLHEILVRCDLRGEARKCIIDALGLSRRQFFRERREALLLLAAAISRELRRPQASSVSANLGDAAEACIDTLRLAGQYRAAWQESRALAIHCAGEPREAKLWSVACEAARFAADPGAAAEALERARRAALRRQRDEGSYLRTLWVAIGEMNLQWAAAECDRVQATFDAVVREGPDELTLQGDEAILFGIMLGYLANVECDRGRWDRVADLLARARRLAERSASNTQTSLLRLSARLASAQGDVERSIVENRSALETERTNRQLGPIAVSAVYFAAAIGDREPARALPYVEYALEIARRYYPGDRLARLTLEALPVILDARGAGEARRAIAEARRPGLGVRDGLFLDLADSKIAARNGDDAGALERAQAAAQGLARRGLGGYACDAELIVVESYAKLGQRRRAQRHLAGLAGAIDSAGSRERARRLGAFLTRSG